MNIRRVAMLAAVLFVAVSASGCGYNSLQGKQQNVRGRWADVESQLQRRADLVPNLVAAAQSAGVQEQEVFGAIAQARSQLLNARDQAGGDASQRTPQQVEAIMAANSGLSGAIGRLLVLQENYPTLRSNENFLNLQTELVGTENRINTSRTDYNAAVQDYNTTRGSFPTVISARIFGFNEEPYFRADEGARQVPRIDPNALRNNRTPGATNQSAAPTTPAAPATGNANSANTQR